MAKERKLKLIHNGDLAALAERFGVSRQTVRNALLLFIRNGRAAEIRQAARELGAVEYED